MNLPRLAAWSIATLVAATAWAAPAPQIVPAAPTAFEPVKLRMTVDSCSFSPGSVRVSAAANVIRVTQQLNMCLAPAPPIVVDVRLGSFPVGDYQVQVYAGADTSGPPALTLALAVTGRAEIAVYPPPPRPLDDYTGMWWTTTESGWGLSLHQSATDAMFGVLFVYGADQQPEWLTLQDGRWTGFATWTATLYRSSGPWYAGAFDPAQVSIGPVGEATIDFTQAPGKEDRAVFTYTIDRNRFTKSIARMRF